jgi:NAD(P)-dependent dehydrogenase (short-subunit alcohol dehydrogenase family)
MNVIITGGGSGLGRAIVEQFSLDAQGKVLFTYHKTSADTLDALSPAANVTALQCDFSSSTDMARIMPQFLAFEADLLVNNAWLNLTRKHFHRFERGEIVASFDRNVAPMVELSRQLLRQFKKRRAGKIINILSSALVNRPPIGMSIYAAEKAYIMQLSKAWVAEFGSFGVAINNILPGFMATNMNADLDDRAVEDIRDATLNGAILSTRDLARTVYLLANMPTHVTGNNLVVNGGENLAT